MKGSRGNVVREENMLPIEKPYQRINLSERITCIGNKALKYAQWLAFSRTVFTVILRSVDYYLTLTRNLVLAKLFRKEA